MWGGTEPERCAACGFDASHYTLDDVRGTLRGLGPWWRETVRDIDDPVLQRRPEPATWSAAEYAQHTSGVLWALGILLERLFEDDDVDLPDAEMVDAVAADEPVHIDISRVCTEIERQAGRLATLTKGRNDIDLARARGRVGGRSIDGGQVIRHAVHDATHHLSDVGRDLHSLVGGAAPVMLGTVAAVNTSPGGVPKRPVTGAQITRRGVDGDGQADRRHHGKPMQALCLWSLDVIEALAADGHPIAPGLAGENLTLAGLDWVSMRPGVRLQLGEAVAELTMPATPCAKNAGWFRDRDFDRINHDTNPGWSRWYAKVLRAGPVAPGDPVVVEPEPATATDLFATRDGNKTDPS